MKIVMLLISGSLALLSATGTTQLSSSENNESFPADHHQSSPGWRHVWTVPAAGDRLFTDNLGNAYVIKNDALTKFRENGTVFRLYSNKNLGRISHVDALNPLKIIVFYKDFSQVLFLDNTVTENGDPIKLQDFGLELASLVAASYDNGIWVFDQVQYTLTRFDQQLKQTVQIQNLQQILGYAPQPVFMAERGNHLYMSVPDQGVLQFDIFGTFVKTIPVTGLSSFEVIEENLYYSDTVGNLNSFGIRSLQESSIPLPIKDHKNFRIEKDRLYLLERIAFRSFFFRNPELTMDFSASNRTSFLKAAESEITDLIIIGGGVTGAGIALDAASRGISVLLLEKNDFASGTSSRSTKLIHGGLRYLKQLDFNLVREVGRERAIAHRNAPHLVIPSPMLLPLIKGGSLKKTSARIALWVYELLAGVRKEECFRMLDKAGSLKAEPLLDEKIVTGAALYTEYRTDDARLTIEILKTAFSAGAKAVNYAEVNDFLKNGGKITGVTVRDKIDNTEYSLKARVVVNAGGPWVDEIRKMDEAPAGKRLHLTKGVHIVVPFEKLPLKQAAYIDAPDGRMIFAIPRNKVTYIGTTDTDYSGDKENPLVTREEAEYLINAANRIFAGKQLDSLDIISSWAGLRPLIHKDGKSPSELSRKDELFISENGLISIAGGKLTGYRKLAERVINQVAKVLVKNYAHKIPESKTQAIRLSGGDYSSAEEIMEYLEVQAGQSREVGGRYEEIQELVMKYGSNTERIIETAFDLWPLMEDKADIIAKAEILYCQQHEMVVHPSDFWIRRSSALYFDPVGIAAEFEKLYPFFISNLTLGAATAQEFRYSFLREADNIKSFRGEI